MTMIFRSIFICSFFLSPLVRSSAQELRHFTWYYLNTRDAADQNRRDWFEQPDGGWREVYPNGIQGHFTLIAKGITLTIFQNGQRTPMQGSVIEKDDKTLLAFIPNQLATGQWLQWKAPGGLSGPWQYAGMITALPGMSSGVQTKATKPALPQAAQNSATLSTANTPTLDDTLKWVQTELSNLEWKQDVKMTDSTGVTTILGTTATARISAISGCTIDSLHTSYVDVAVVNGPNASINTVTSNRLDLTQADPTVKIESKSGPLSAAKPGIQQVCTSGCAFTRVTVRFNGTSVKCMSMSIDMDGQNGKRHMDMDCGDGSSWSILTADYDFAQRIAKALSTAVTKCGGKAVNPNLY